MYYLFRPLIVSAVLTSSIAAKEITNESTLADRITNAGVAINNSDVTTWGANPIKDEKGTYHLYFKAIKKDDPWETKMGLAVADRFEGPYTIQKDPVTANDVSIEGGYVFLDKEGVVNFITTDNHGIIEKGGGLLWKSKDGMKFGKPTLAYHRLDTYIKKSDYPKAKTIYGSGIWRLERPQILVENGEPKYLYAPSGISLDADKGTESHVLEIK